MPALRSWHDVFEMERRALQRLVHFAVLAPLIGARLNLFENASSESHRSSR
jgi:hypothetical protein